MNFEIKFSLHALRRMEERKISRDLVRKAIEFPDKTEKSLIDPSRFLIYKLYFNEKLKREHLLLIICEVKQNLINIITIIDTSKISKYF